MGVILHFHFVKYRRVRHRSSFEATLKSFKRAGWPSYLSPVLHRPSPTSSIIVRTSIPRRAYDWSHQNRKKYEMGEPSQIGQRPSSATPAHTGSVPDAAPATNSAAGRVKPGNWAAPTYSDLDKAVKNDLDELVTASDNYVFDLGFLVSAASLVVRTS